MEGTAVEVARWEHHDTDRVTVYEDANDALPWKLVWEHGDDVHEEEYVVASGAFARLAVLSFAIEADVRVVHNVADDRQARVSFTEVVSRFLLGTTDDAHGLDDDDDEAP